MNVLYIAPVTDQSSAVNGGYSEIAYSFNKLFLNLKKENIIGNYTVINPTEQRTPVELCPNYDFGIVLTHPDSFNYEGFKQSIESARKVCNKFYLHIFWEMSTLPENWNWLFKEDLFTGFISSSNFVKDAIELKIIEFKSKQSNIKVYPVLYREDYTNAEINVQSKLKEEIFTVLYMGQYTKRKGMEDAVIAFAHALGKNSDCQLILKYHRLSQLEFPEEDMIKRTIAMNCKDFKAHVYTITDNFNREQIFDLYKSSSAVLHPSRGEGFGFVIVESDIIGIPIIYANNSSCREVAGDNRSYAIPCYQDTPVGMAQYNYPPDGTYGIPFMGSMIDALKNAYDLWKENKEEYYNVGTEDFIFNKFSEEIVTEQIMRLI